MIRSRKRSCLHPTLSGSKALARHMTITSFSHAKNLLLAPLFHCGNAKLWPPGRALRALVFLVVGAHIGAKLHTQTHTHTHTHTHTNQESLGEPLHSHNIAAFSSSHDRIEDNHADSSPGYYGSTLRVLCVKFYHSHGHGHGVFILATHPEGK
jgi:hypothetical protein